MLQNIPKLPKSEYFQRYNPANPPHAKTLSRKKIIPARKRMKLKKTKT